MVVEEDAFEDVKYVSYSGLSRVPTRTDSSSFRERKKRDGGEMRVVSLNPYEVRGKTVGSPR